MLRSFNSLALRQLRTRPLRSALTTFGVVLGVGMVFGVLLLVGTIRATFDEVIDSAWGETDLIVMGEGNGTMPHDTRRPHQATSRACATRPGWSAACSRGCASDGSPVKGNKGQMLIAGYEPEGYQPYDFRVVEGRKMRTGVEMMVERNWARDRGYEVGDRVPVAGPTGPHELPIIGIFKLTSSLNVGGLGYAAMPLDAARRALRPAQRLDADLDHGARPRRRRTRSRSASSARWAPARACRRPARSRTRSTSSSRG